MLKTINRQWRTYQLRRRMEAVDAFYSQKISVARSSLEARKHHQEKVDSICALASRYLAANSAPPSTSGRFRF